MTELPAGSKLIQSVRKDVITNLSIMKRLLRSSAIFNYGLFEGGISVIRCKSYILLFSLDWL